MILFRIQLKAVILVILFAIGIDLAEAQKPDDPAYLQEIEEAQRLIADADKVSNSGADVEVKRAAVRKYAAAAMIFRRLSSNHEEADTLEKLGKLYDSLGDARRAAETRKFMALLRDPGFNAEETLANTNIPTIRSRYGMLEGRSSGAVTLNNLSSNADQQISNNRLLEYFSKELIAFRRSGDRRAEAMVLTRLGTIYGLSDNRAQALRSFGQALSLRRRLKDPVGEAVTLNSLGRFYDSIGEKSKAVVEFQRALRLTRKAGSRSVEAATSNNLATVYASTGNRQLAIEYYEKSLSLRRETGDVRGAITTLNNIGTVYGSLGEKRKALEYYRAALDRSTNVVDHEAKSSLLHNMGEAYHSLGESDEALRYYSEALDRREERQDLRGLGITLNSIGRVYEDRGNREKAIEYYERSLQMRRRSGDKSGEATTLNNLGAAHLSSSGQNQKALEYLLPALSLRRSVGDKSGEAATLHNLMFARRAQGHGDLAILLGKQSINNYQALRADLRDFDLATRSAYSATIERTYREVAEILVEKGRIADAEEVLRMIKEDEYLSYLRRDSSAATDLKSRIALSPEEKIAFADYEKYAGEITAAGRRLASLEQKKNELALGESLSPEDQKVYDRLKMQYDASVTVFNKYLEDLKIKFSEKDVRVVSVESDTVGLLRNLNEPRTVIISTIAGDDRLSLIVTTSDVQTAHTTAIKIADLNKLVADFRSAVANPKLDPRGAGKKLYDVLFPAALRKDLENINADTIIWSLDGTLRYIPTSALWDGEKYLAQRYRTAVITLASRDKLASAKGKAWQALGVGVSKPVGNFSALPAVPRELCSVVNDPKKRNYCKDLGPSGGGMINGLMLADEEFTLANFRNLLGRTPVVHIASHFALNPGNEVDSFLLLGGGDLRRFSLEDLRKTRLDNVDLLTLSACNTAMSSGSNSSGIEVEGFGALAQKQGVKSVLATLWSVADESTQGLMSEFYRLKMQNPEMSKAEALQSAQLAMIEGRIKATSNGSGCRAELNSEPTGSKPFRCDTNAPFSHPFFWSPFVLIGNWR